MCKLIQSHTVKFYSVCSCLYSSFISYTMAVIAVNFVVPLSVMFYCYYNVSVTVKRYKASNCLDSINVDWSDQMDVTKVNKTSKRWNVKIASVVMWLCRCLSSWSWCSWWPGLLTPWCVCGHRSVTLRPSPLPWPSSRLCLPSPPPSTIPASTSLPTKSQRSLVWTCWC